MAVDDPDVENLILRFRDLATPPGETIRRHAEIAAGTATYVWWGWWNKAGESIPHAVFRALRERAIQGNLEILLFDSGHLQLYKAKCTDISWGGTGDAFATPEGDKTPAYYRDTQYKAWFKFSVIAPTPISGDPADEELRKWTYLRVDSFFETRESRYDRFYSKRIFSREELRQQDRTIWFVRPWVAHDPVHQISLLDARALTPKHFVQEPTQTHSKHLLWLSDTHYSTDNHAFPIMPTADERPLSIVIEETLRSARITDLGGVIVSGDLTWKATTAEFDMARSALSYTLSWARLQPYQIAICPGNHDLRFSPDPAVKTNPVTIVGPESRAAYDSFYRDLFYITPNEFLSCGRRFLLGGTHPVDVVCLNSSLLQQFEGLFQGHGFVGQSQLNQAAEQMGWKDGDTLRAYRILVLHHHLLPVLFRDRLALDTVYSVALDAEAIMQWVARHRVDLVLHGHMHTPFYTRVARPVTYRKYDGDWHTFPIAALGSAGVARPHRGEEKNSFGVIDFSDGSPTLRVFEISARGAAIESRISLSADL